MSSHRSTIPPSFRSSTPDPEPPKKSWTRADTQFLIGAILAMLIWGLQLIGLSVNLWLGAVVLAIAFILMMRAFWVWEGPSHWHVVWRVITLALASMIYVTAVGWQIRAEWVREHPKTAIEKIIPEQSQPAQKQAQEKKSKPQENESVKKNVRPPKTKRHSQGDNSPNVGSITQGPGSIAQVGGQGNQATVNNYGPPSRRIHAAGRATVLATLKTKPGKITIYHTMGDEPYQFATDMYEVLQDAGWNVVGPLPVVQDKPWKGLMVRFHAREKPDLPNGTRVNVPPNSLAGTLIRAVMQANVSCCTVQPTAEEPEDSISLVIGPYPSD